MSSWSSSRRSSWSSWERLSWWSTTWSWSSWTSKLRCTGWLRKARGGRTAVRYCRSRSGPCAEFFTPGSWTTMLEPWMPMFGLARPSPFARACMMPTTVSSSAVVAFPTGWKTTDRPPSRSSPSFGDQPAATTAARDPKQTTQVRTTLSEQAPSQVLPPPLPLPPGSAPVLFVSGIGRIDWPRAEARRTGRDRSRRPGRRDRHRHTSRRGRRSCRVRPVRRRVGQPPGARPR